ncbi:MAG: 30S ribosomal subunit protein S6 [Candidatus Westeberhardia cardiocondylae]|nr:30S ribosomal subunit protein S6 [Candidatus Westeberhardia cardiocondylae]
MRHYEIILMISPDKEHDINNVLEACFLIVNKYSGVVYRLEYWGCRKLSYPIKKFYQAYYVLMNVEIAQTALDEIRKIFIFDDVVIRSMIIRVRCAVTKISPIMQENEKIL